MRLARFVARRRVEARHRAAAGSCPHRSCRAHRRCRRATEAGFGLGNPNIDFAKLAQSLGVASSGPIADPNDLAAAIRRGIGVVKGGEPYLIDVVTQPLAAFTTWVRNGTPGRSIASGMPAFPPAVVSDAELANVRAISRTCRRCGPSTRSRC